MKCADCTHWKRPLMSTSKWGTCTELTEDSPEISINTNNKEGEWVETTIETFEKFYCKLFKEER